MVGFPFVFLTSSLPKYVAKCNLRRGFSIKTALMSDYVTLGVGEIKRLVG